MEQVYVLKKGKGKSSLKMSKKLIEEVVVELIGEEALGIIFYLKGKTKISEFIIAEELELEIHKTRNLLYRLFEHNIVGFIRKKDKIKGWYICYWDFNEHIILELALKLRRQKVAKLEERLKAEKNDHFYMCKNACARMNFETAIEYNFKCAECGELMNGQDNRRTIEFLTERLKELESEI